MALPMARAQIFMFDVIIATTAFLLMALVVVSISRQAVPPMQEVAYGVCVSALESLKANGTLSDVANETSPESLLNNSLLSLPSRFGYELNITTYSLSGAEGKRYYGISGNLTDAELRGNIISVQSSFVTTNETPLMGSARLRCWVGK